MKTKNIEIIPGEKIVQLWQYDYPEWPKDHFSKITIKFEKGKTHKTRILFWQSDIPEQYADDIDQGWKDYYWEPLKEMVSKKISI